MVVEADEYSDQSWLRIVEITTIVRESPRELVAEMPEEATSPL